MRLASKARRWLRICVGLAGTGLTLWAQAGPLRPPATPLVAHDPYFSIWSMSDKLTDQPTKHWTGTEQQIASFVRVDGKAYRLMGDNPRDVPPLPQTEQKLTPTRTTYSFAGAGVNVSLEFLTPAIPQDLDLLSRPVTYLTWEVRSTDGQPHEVGLYFDATSQLAVNHPEQRVNTSRVRIGDLQVLRVGSVEQAVLAKAGDNLRIDWGHLYVAVPPQEGASLYATHHRNRPAWVRSGQLPADDDLDLPSQTSRFLPAMAATFNLRVAASPVTRWLMLAYDDQFAIQYFQRNLRPYWRRNGMGAAELLRTAAQDYDKLRARTAQLDRALRADLEQAGGPEYAELAILAYRQTLAAHKLVADLDGTPLYFSKENFSNGCIDTVDVTYPSAPFFLLLNPQLLKAQLRPILDYASLPRWKFPFAPHDLGTYPLANGQVYGGGERTEENQMPVEESGNMLLLLAALAKAENSAEFSGHYWPVLTRWASYLQTKGMDPENQLSTDDFAGHLAHNTNLSLKAILALGAYAQLADSLGKKDEKATYRHAAQEMARRWPAMAADGDHYKLAFDKPGTWSQKYNLVWDKLLGLSLFPAEIASKELAFYKTHQNQFGLPLDNRETYTKLDWIVWTATMTDNAADFTAFIHPVYEFLSKSPSRVPLTDWFDTKDGKQRGFQARSVVGGVYIKMLADPTRWRRWAAQTSSPQSARD